MIYLQTQEDDSDYEGYINHTRDTAYYDDEQMIWKYKQQ